jgi:hypothetical protein
VTGLEHAGRSTNLAIGAVRAPNGVRHLRLVNYSLPDFEQPHGKATQNASHSGYWDSPQDNHSQGSRKHKICACEVRDNCEDENDAQDEAEPHASQPHKSQGTPKPTR